MNAAERVAAMKERLTRIKSRFARSKLARKFASGMIWLTIGMVPSRLATLLATVVVARILGKATYGDLTLARSTVNAFVTVAAFGSGRAAAKFVAELLVTDKERVGRIVALNYLATVLSSSIVAVFFLYFADYLCNVMINAPELVFQVRLCSPLLVLTALVGAQIGALTGFQAYRSIAISATISGFAMIPFYAFGAKFWGLTGATLGFTTGTLLNFLCNSFFIFRLVKMNGVRYHFLGCWREAPVLWNFCLPSTLLSLVMSGATWFATILLARQPSGTSELGVFDAARQIQTAVLYLPVLAANIVVPTLSELGARKDLKSYITTVRYNIGINAAFTVALAVVFSLASKWIMASFGKEFESGASTLVVLLATCALVGVSNVYGSALTSLGALWSRFWYTVVWSVVVVECVLALEPFVNGALGLAIAMLLAYACQTACLAARTRALLKNAPFDDELDGRR